MESQLEMIQQWEVAVKDFRKLLVWEKAHQLTLAIYQVTAVFPSAETYGLTSQMRRAAASIPSNIAEGSGRDGDAAYGCLVLRITLTSKCSDCGAPVRLGT